MDLKKLTEKTVPFLKKYKYVALVLLIGLVLMALPSKTATEKEPQSQSETILQPEVTVSQQLSTVLSMIDGAGKVEVMLTVAAGEETVFQTNSNTSTSETATSTQISTVTITDADRNQTGLIRQINPPRYLGAVIVCEGADSPAVCLAIVDAVSKVTGLGSDRISVLKMK